MIKNKRIKLPLMALLFAFALTLSACSHIEDDNGDDTSLSTFSLADRIESKSFSNVSSVSSTISTGGTTHSFSYEEIDYDHISMTVGKFSGVNKIHVSDMEQGETLILTIESELESGNLEIVVIDPNNDIIVVVPINTIHTFEIASTIEGEYFVIVGGETAKYSITIDRQIN